MAFLIKQPLICGKTLEKALIDSRLLRKPDKEGLKEDEFAHVCAYLCASIMHRNR